MVICHARGPALHRSLPISSGEVLGSTPIPSTDADELARSRLAFRPGELKSHPGMVPHRNSSTRIYVNEHWGGGMGKFLLVLPNRLAVEISGPNEGEVHRHRAMRSRNWGGRNLIPITGSSG